MKTPIKFKRMAAIGITCITIICMSGCKKDTLQNPVSLSQRVATYRITSILDAGVTKTGSKATGELSGLYSTISKKMIFALNFKQIEPSLIEFRNEKNVVVGTIKSRKAKYVSPVKGEVILSNAGQESLTGKKISIYLISTQFPNGEISGLLSLKNSN